MGIKEKLNAIRKSRNSLMNLGFFEDSERGKTGILNGILFFGALAGALIAIEQSHAASGSEPPKPNACIDKAPNDAGISSADLGMDSGSWNNHHWTWVWSWGSN